MKHFEGCVSSSNTKTNKIRMNVVITLWVDHSQSVRPWPVLWIAVASCHHPSHWFHQLLTMGVDKYIITCPKSVANHSTNFCSKYLSFCHITGRNRKIQSVMMLAGTKETQLKRVTSIGIKNTMHFSLVWHWAHMDWTWVLESLEKSPTLAMTLATFSSSS